MKRKTTKPMIMREPLAGYDETAIVIYQSPEGIRVDVKLERETVWLTQKQMAELFETERSVITKHLRNIFTSGELNQDSNVQKMHIAGSDKPVAFYALDAMTLLIAESQPREKDILTRVLINLISRREP